MRVALFVTCFNDAPYPCTGKAVVRLLERLGHEMAFPVAQTCRGQMHVNTSYYREAGPMAHRFLGVFDPCQAIVSPPPSCLRPPGGTRGRARGRTWSGTSWTGSLTTVPGWSA